MKVRNDIRKKYDQNVDYFFLRYHEVNVIRGKDPWVFILKYPDMHNGWMVWFPTTGTLMHENLWSQCKYNLGRFLNSEDVFDKIMDQVIYEQNHS